MVATGVAVFAICLSAAAAQDRLVKNQSRLDELNGEIRVERERQFSLRRQETLLRSPQDVADIAVNRLGMVRPEVPLMVTAKAPEIKPSNAGLTASNDAAKASPTP